jgi:hypothetical protein
LRKGSGSLAMFTAMRVQLPYGKTVETQLGVIYRDRQRLIARGV